MDVEIYLLSGSILMFVLAIFLAICKYREKRPVTPLAIAKNFRKKINAEERRIYPRYKTALRIKYKIPLELKESICWVKDISRGGLQLFLIDNLNLKIGTLLSLEINLPYDNKPIFAQSRIVWTQGDDTGLSFDTVEEEDINRIFRYISNRKRIKIQ